jgi:hypothetical protein
MRPERVIPGQVVPADDDNSGPVQPQETFLHKVASGTSGSGPAGQRARTDASDGARRSDDSADAEDDTEVIAVASAAEAPDAAAADTAGEDTADTDAPYADTAYSDTAAASTVDASTADADVIDATADTDMASMDTDMDTTDAEAMDADATVTDATVTDAAVVDVAEADAVEAGVPAVAETRTDAPPARVPDGTAPNSSEPLLGEATALVREEWRQVQASFVDDPRASVTAAAGVVADAAARLESLLRERQRSLRGSWDGNGQADTETLRQLMLMYRKLLTKLIS